VGYHQSAEDDQLRLQRQMILEAYQRHLHWEVNQMCSIAVGALAKFRQHRKANQGYGEIVVLVLVQYQYQRRMESDHQNHRQN
jgi:hypothetical protein